MRVIKLKMAIRKKFFNIAISFAFTFMIWIRVSEGLTYESTKCFDLQVKKCPVARCRTGFEYLFRHRTSAPPAEVEVNLTCPESQSVNVTNVTYLVPSTHSNYCIGQNDCAKSIYYQDCVCCTQPDTTELCSLSLTLEDLLPGSILSCKVNSTSQCKLTAPGHTFTAKQCGLKYGRRQLKCGSNQVQCYSRWVQVQYDCIGVIKVEENETEEKNFTGGNNTMTNSFSNDQIKGITVGAVLAAVLFVIIVIVLVCLLRKRCPRAKKSIVQKSKKTHVHLNNQRMKTNELGNRKSILAKVEQFESSNLYYEEVDGDNFNDNSTEAIYKGNNSSDLPLSPTAVVPPVQYNDRKSTSVEHIYDPTYFDEKMARNNQRVRNYENTDKNNGNSYPQNNYENNDVENFKSTSNTNNSAINENSYVNCDTTIRDSQEAIGWSPGLENDSVSNINNKTPELVHTNSNGSKTSENRYLKIIGNEDEDSAAEMVENNYYEKGADSPLAVVNAGEDEECYSEIAYK